MNIIVLAGGRSSRLGAIGDEMPKFLVPVGSRCFADIQLAWLKQNGFHHVTLSVGYRAEQIMSYCGDGTRFGVKIQYVSDGPTPLGTAGAIKKAFLQTPSHRQSCVMYGDTILDFDVKKALYCGPELMTVIRCPPGYAPNAQLQSGRVRYNKRLPSPGWHYIDYGFLLLSAGFMQALPDRGDIADALAAISLNGFEAKKPFWEINTPESLAAFRQHFSSP